MTYTIKLVTPEVRDYSTQYGDMKSYKLILNEMYDPNLSDFEQTVVELSQKASTPAPKVGDKLEGTVDMSGQFGPKFKKDYAGGARPGGGGGPTRTSDPKTFYISYAKDIMVAIITAGHAGKPEQITYSDVIEQVAEQGLRLMELANKPTTSEDDELAEAKKVFSQ